MCENCKYFERSFKELLIRLFVESFIIIQRNRDILQSCTIAIFNTFLYVAETFVWIFQTFGMQFNFTQSFTIWSLGENIVFYKIIFLNIVVRVYTVDTTDFNYSLNFNDKTSFWDFSIRHFQALKRYVKVFTQSKR